MEKMKMESIDGVQNNIEKIAELFPNCITEALDTEKSTPDHPVYKKAINFKNLKQMLSEDIADENEAYELTWVGKKESIIEANKSINKTLRPHPEKSINWDSTENLYIEGDNLEVLKLLQESYLQKVNVIYIDPPYNTGNDILYKNDFSEEFNEYDEKIAIDENGNRLFFNNDSNGRFHSDWCSMMYERISLAKNLLAEDGFFLVAIDHNELFNLGNICDEILGYSNRIGIISVVHKPEGRNQAKFIGPSNEFMLVYAKNEQVAKIRKVAIDEEQISLFDNQDENGRYRLKNFIRLSDGKYATREAKPDFWYPIYVSKDLKKLSLEPFPESQAIYPITKQGVERTWKTTSNTFLERYNSGDIIAKRDEHGDLIIFEKLREDQVIKTHWINKKYHGYHFGTKILDDLLGVKTFDFPKSLYLMRDIYKLFAQKDALILDFFSGSATSAHAINLLNLEDGGTRKYIMAQIPASIDSKSAAGKAGFNNICEIGEARIKRAAEKIKRENPSSRNDLDLGFRIFSVDESNMNDVYYHPNQYNQDRLFSLESNIKEDRSDLDLFFGCILDWGLPLTLPYSTETIGGFRVHNYNNGDLIACFEENVSEELVKEIASRQPMRVVFRDSSFGNSPEKINVFEIFKKYMPEDADDISKRVKVI